jgi:hypothetical protein
LTDPDAGLSAAKRRRKKKRIAAAAAAAVAAAAAAGPVPPRPDNTRANGGGKVAGRCFSVASINLARDCISKLCFLSMEAGDVQFESREER